MAAAEHKINLSTEDGHQYALMLWAQQASVRRRWPELALTTLRTSACAPRSRPAAASGWA